RPGHAVLGTVRGWGPRDAGAAVQARPRRPPPSATTSEPAPDRPGARPPARACRARRLPRKPGIAPDLPRLPEVPALVGEEEEEGEPERVAYPRHDRRRDLDPLQVQVAR